MQSYSEIFQLMHFQACSCTINVTLKKIQRGWWRRVLPLFKTNKPIKTQSCVQTLWTDRCACVWWMAVEVLRSHSVHGLAWGPEGEGGSWPLLPGALPKLWPQLHQHVLEPGELHVSQAPLTGGGTENNCSLAKNVSKDSFRTKINYIQSDAFSNIWFLWFQIIKPNIIWPVGAGHVLNSRSGLLLLEFLHQCSLWFCCGSGSPAHLYHWFWCPTFTLTTGFTSGKFTGVPMVIKAAFGTFGSLDRYQDQSSHNQKEKSAAVASFSPKEGSTETILGKLLQN